MNEPTCEEIRMALKYWARQREPLNRGVDTNWEALREAEQRLEELARGIP